MLTAEGVAALGLRRPAGSGFALLVSALHGPARQTLHMENRDRGYYDFLGRKRGAIK